MKQTSALLLMSLYAITTALPYGAHAENLLQTFSKVAADPTGLVRTTDNVRETALGVLAQIQPLIGVADAKAKERLDQIHTIIQDSLNGAVNAEAKALTNLRALEVDVLADVDHFIGCLGPKTGQQVQQAISDAANGIAASHPSIRVFGFKLVSLEFKQQALSDPSKAYTETRKAVMTDLDYQVRDTSNPFEIKKSYANLQLLANATRCKYELTGLQTDFSREIARLKVLQDEWDAVVILSIQ